LFLRWLFVTLYAMRFFIFCLWFLLAASAFGTELKINFNNFSEGQTPTNFHSALAGSGASGIWKIMMADVPPTLAPLTDKAIVSRRAVLAQTSTDTTDERFPMFIYDEQSFKDFKLTTRFKIIGGSVEQMAGVVFRFQNESNFYVLRASALGDNLSFYKIQNGQLVEPLKVQMEISTNVWHTLGVQCSGNKIDGEFDGTNVIKAIDNRGAKVVGKIGFWTKSDAVSYFADADIDYKPLIPVAQALINQIMERQPGIVALRIYRLDDKGEPRIIASKDEKEIGQQGTESEHDAIAGGKLFFGRGKGTVTVTMPFRDHNGDPMAAMRVQLKASLLETQDMAITRATMILKQMQAQISTTDELTQ
jgi:hypothetical protein